MAVGISLAGAASVPAWAQPPATPAVAHVDAKKDKSIKVEKTPAAATAAAAPDADLLDYLGSYGGAADGFDPLGLADADAAPPPASAAKDRQ